MHEDAGELVLQKYHLYLLNVRDEIIGHYANSG